MKTLVCTVGGSPQPILQAIQHHAPDHVIFVCSQDDPLTEKRGSYVEVEFKNPSLPTQADLPAGAWSVIKVPADDPSAAIVALEEPLAKAVRAGDCVADYTGGTKSMCAALFYAAAQLPEVQLSVVTGPRNDLVQVTDLEEVRQLSSRGLQRARLRAEVTRCWRDFGYAEAHRLLAGARPDVRDAEMSRATHLSKAFASWDASDHAAALPTLERYGRFAGELLPTLRALVTNGKEAEALHIVDLYVSVERRRRGHQYDAAVLRLYRVFEWIARWTLQKHHHTDTSNVAGDSPLADLAHKSANGKLVLGCESAWRAVARLSGPLGELASAQTAELRDLALRRNESLLTHGRRVLGENDVDHCKALLDRAVWPRFLEVARVREHQLPTVLPVSGEVDTG